MWNQIALARVLLDNMICDQYFLPSLYRSKLEVVLYDMTKPRTVPMLLRWHLVNLATNHGVGSFTHTVNNVGWIDKSRTFFMMRDIAVAHPVKKRSRCQHLKKAVARRACANDVKKLRGPPKGSTAFALKWLDCMY